MITPKIHTTNYYGTLIEVAPDCPVRIAVIPPQRETKTVANIEYDIIANNPYKYTSDEVLFKVFSIKNNITKQNMEQEKKKFFSKGQPCLRSSPLTKQYRWGIHSNSEGKIALYPMESKEYKKLCSDESIKKIKAMKSKR